MYHFFFLTEYWETGFKWKRGHKRSENNYHIYIYTPKDFMQRKEKYQFLKLV